MRLADRVQLVLEALEDVAGPEERQPLRRNGMDLRGLLRELRLEPRRWIADDSPADGLAVDELHRERLAAAELREVRDGPRHLDARLERRLEDVKLVRQRKRVLVDHPAACAPDEQPLALGLHRPRLLRRAAGEQAHRRDAPAQLRRELVSPRRYQADWPPSTTRVCAVTYADAGDARKTITPFRSLGSPKRPSGMCSMSVSPCCSRTKLAMSDGNHPGAMALTRIPWRAHLVARSRVNEITPPL